MKKSDFYDDEYNELPPSDSPMSGWVIAAIFFVGFVLLGLLVRS